MTLLESIKAVREAANKLIPEHPCDCEQDECVACREDKALLAAITAAEAAAAAQDAAYKRAREAWKFHRVPMMDRSIAWIGDNKEAVSILNEYFKGGE